MTRSPWDPDPPTLGAATNAKTPRSHEARGRGFAPDAPEAFVREATVVAAHPFLPELRLHLAEDFTSLWEAVQRRLCDADAPPPYWANAWPGGLALARFLLDRAESLEGRRVFDFATGSGICGIAAALRGAAVVACDLDEAALAAARLNARLARVALETTCVDPIHAGVPTGFDVILAGDVCYEGAHAKAIVEWLRRCARAGLEVYLGEPGRTYAPTDGVVELARMDVPTSGDIEGVAAKRARVLRVVG